MSSVGTAPDLHLYVLGQWDSDHGISYTHGFWTYHLWLLAENVAKGFFGFFFCVGYIFLAVTNSTTHATLWMPQETFETGVCVVALCLMLNDHTTPVIALAR